MIFLDESGDDGSKENSSARFFVVSILDSDIVDLKEKYFLIKDRLGVNKKDYKWNTLKRAQKLQFYNTVKDLNFDINISFVDKSKFINFDNMYLNLAIFAFRNSDKDQIIIYVGEHLGKMFDKVRRFYKKDNKNLSFRKAKGDEIYGVLVADLWAGYINYLLKSKMDIPININLIINELPIDY